VSRDGVIAVALDQDGTMAGGAAAGMDRRRAGEGAMG
jgi:hypothetical protein